MDHTKTRWTEIVPIDRTHSVPLQAQIRAGLVRAISARALPPGFRLPSTRTLALGLRVARNTVILAYRELVDDGWLRVTGRGGHLVSDDAAVPPEPVGWRREPAGTAVDWGRRLVVRASAMAQVVKPREALSYPYPFVYGAFDPSTFSLRAWRDASRLALRPRAVDVWAGDRIDADDPELLEQISQRLLPRRGIRATPDQILITLGAQQATALVAAALSSQPALAAGRSPGRGRDQSPGTSHRFGRTVVGLESPGYPDAWNVWSLHGAQTVPLPVDELGLRITARLARCDVVQVSPSHQNPTTVTMPPARRRALLRAAVEHDLIVIEDDYDSELAFDGGTHAAIKAMDEDERVVYIGSLSKTLAPGLRLGYLVGAAPLIAEARALRRLMIRHPPTNNQRALAAFLALGHHDAGVRRMVARYRERAEVLVDALRRHLPALRFGPPTGGSSLWAIAPDDVDTDCVARYALGRGVLFDAGAVFWRGSNAPPANTLRLGFASIPAERIEPGIRELSRAFAEAARARGVAKNGSRAVRS